MTLGKRYVDRGIGRVHPALSDQNQRRVSWDIIAKVDFDVMIARNALILATPKGVEIFAIQIAQDVGYILSVVVDRARNRMRRFNGCDGKLRRRNYKSFVDKNVSTSRMIDRHQI